MDLKTSELEFIQNEYNFKIQIKLGFEDQVKVLLGQKESNLYCEFV